MEKIYFAVRTMADTAELYWDKPEDAEAAYEFVDDDGELEYMSKVFAELMSDLGVDIE